MADNSFNGDDQRELKRRRRRQIALAADYATGYAKPDPAHQFKAGNKMGARPRQPKPSPSHDELMTQIGEEKIPVNRKGRKENVSRNIIILNNLVNDAMRGDWRARKYWLDEQKRIKSTPRHAIENVDYNSGAELVRRKLEEMAKRSEEERIAKEQGHQHVDAINKKEDK